MKAMLFLLGLTALAPEALAQKPKIGTYVVQEGETCESIAQKLYGDRKLAKSLHQYNLLGSSPHLLKKGQKLYFLQETPDATLTKTIGGVRLLSHLGSEWQEASEGTKLYVTWRAATLEGGSAELTFNNGALASLRERAELIIYGGDELATVLRKDKAQAELVRGTLLAKPKSELTLLTPAALVELGPGSAVVTVAQDGSTSISNHEAKSLLLLVGEAKERIELEAGTGIKLIPNQETPSLTLLPAAPKWDPKSATVALTGLAPTATLRGTWLPVEGAQGYIIELSRDAKGAEVIQRFSVAKDASSFEATLPPGQYYASVSSIDADLFESTPSRIALRVEAPTFYAQDGSPILPAQLSVGSTFQAPEGYSCAKSEYELSKPKLSFEKAGAFTLRCRNTQGASLAPISVEVSPIQIQTLQAPSVLPRAQSIQLAFQVSGAFDETLRLEENVYAALTSLQKQSDGTWKTTITVTGNAPTSLSLRFLAGSRRSPIVVGELPMVVEALPSTPPLVEPTEPGDPRRKLSVGTLAGASVHKSATLGEMNPSPLFVGMRFGVSKELASLEGEVKFSLPTEGATEEFNAGLQARMALTSQGVAPFFLMGAGVEVGGVGPMPFFSPGLGVEYEGKGGFGVRADLRAVLLPTAEPDNVYGESSVGFFIRR